MAAEKTGSEVLLEELREKGAPDELIGRVQRGLAKHATNSDVINLLYSQIDTNTKIGAVLVELSKKDGADVIGAMTKFVAGVKDQLAGLNDFVRSVSSDDVSAEERKPDVE